MIIRKLLKIILKNKIKKYLGGGEEIWNRMLWKFNLKLTSRL